jgi:hypothetical protein
MDRHTETGFEPFTPTHLEIPERTGDNGRKNGRWLERQCKKALKRWGFIAETHADVYGMEADVVARRRRPNNEPSDCIVAECKDWDETPIPPRVLHRLCMLAFTCQAMPLLCHTTRLTSRAAEIARNWEIRVVTYRELQRGTLPGPQMVDFQSYSYSAMSVTANMRGYRGYLPVMFRDYHPFSDLSYVPGYEPCGKYSQYRPVTISRSNPEAQLGAEPARSE